MKGKSFRAILSSLLIWVALTAPAWAGQVVTEEVRSWAREALEQEKALETVSVPDTAGILYFYNKTDWSNLDLLQKGLAIMLMTDLSNVIEVVERPKLQALVDELDLRVSGLVQLETASRMGRLLGAEYLVGGDIVRSRMDEFQLKSSLLNVPTEELLGQPTAEGELLGELFRMEKDLLFEIIEALETEVSPEIEAKLREAVTDSLQALLYFFEGIEQSDLGSYQEAAEFYIKALEIDPDFELAREALQELLDLGLVVLPEAYSEPERGIRPELSANMPPDDRGISGIDERRPDLPTPPPPSPTPPPPECVFCPGEFNDEGSWTSDDYDFWTGYQYGLQTIGQDDYDSGPKLFTSKQALDEYNADCSLAYKVQQEEDYLNEQIIERAHHRDAMKVRVAAYTAQKYCDIRARDAVLTEMADAQSGRVLKDREGNWVRAQQYVLRPDAKTVQLLNVCLRGETDLSSMDFTTRFTESYAGDLRDLPWNQWLDNPRSAGGSKYVVSPSGAPLLDNIYVAFTNPSDESLKEQRWFADLRTHFEPPNAPPYDGQRITSEELTLISLANGSQTYGYDYDTANPIGNGIYYAESHAYGGFDYVFSSGGEDPQRINVEFFVVGDVDENGGKYTGEINDIWDALRVNETGAPNIGNNNLEIAIDAGRDFFSRPIDVVYIPMSRMLWKDL